MFEELTNEQTNEMKELLKKSGSKNKEESFAATRVLAEVLGPILRQGVLPGNTLLDLFQKNVFEPWARVEYPIDFFRPDNINDFTAYSIPNQGKIPQRQIEGDNIQVPTYRVGNSIDWLLQYARDARWDIVSRAIEVLEAGFVKKANDDSWHVIQAAGFDRNILVNDSNATAGQFTKRLVSLMKLVMRRNGGGNTASLNRSGLTHLFVSPESIEDMRNWGIDEADDITRREIWLSDDSEGVSVFGVKILPLDELGEGQEYQTYYTNVIATGAANSGLASGDVELVIGIDATRPGSFVMPVREELEIFTDETLHRSSRAGLYAWTEYGLSVLDGSKVLLGSL